MENEITSYIGDSETPKPLGPQSLRVIQIGIRAQEVGFNGYLGGEEGSEEPWTNEGEEEEEEEEEDLLEYPKCLGH